MTMTGFYFCNHGSVSLIYSHNGGKGRIHDAADSKEILRTCLIMKDTPATELLVHIVVKRKVEKCVCEELEESSKLACR